MGWVIKQAPDHECEPPTEITTRVPGDMWACDACSNYWLVEYDSDNRRNVWIPVSARRAVQAYEQYLLRQGIH